MLVKQTPPVFGMRVGNFSTAAQLYQGQTREESRMTKGAFAILAMLALVMTTPLVTSTPAAAQVDVQIGPNHDRDRDRDRDRDHFRRPGIVVGEPRCHTVTITERHYDRTVTRTVRRCD
jgi:hypothetical protein